MLNGKKAGSITLSGIVVAVLLLVSSVTSGAASVNPNLMGINIAAPLDWEGDRLYADLIRMSRDFLYGLNENSPNQVRAPLDADGWPMSDFSFYVWAGIGRMNGAYTLSFKGQAHVYAQPLGNIPVFYDPASNTSTGTFIYMNAAPGYLALRFSGTRRTSADVLGSGVTAIKLMRPLNPGFFQSYPPTTLFAVPPKVLISKFSVVRFMDFLATNWNAQTNWSDRALPSAPSFNRTPVGYGWQGLGGPWEHVIMLMNETGKDAWINIPVRATDAYIKNVALMFLYGSDGVNPYTSPQANPVYPPLNANLNVYVEYSNELWNWAFLQFNDNCQAASDEVVGTAGKSPLNWDGIWTPGTAYASWPKVSTMDWRLCNRHTAERSVQISNIFRSVFGDAAMQTRIRPVLMGQLGGASLFDETIMMLNYYDNMAGNPGVTAHAPSYYFYGAGGSAYYNPAATVSTLDALFADPGMTPAGTALALKSDAVLVADMGLKRVAYEGGPSLDKTGGPRDAISAQAVNDPRMTTAMVNMHNGWSNNNGDLLVYYDSTGDYQWGFTPDSYNLSTPKLQAVDALNAAQRAPLTLGTPVPGSIAGKNPDICSRGWGCDPIQPWDSFTADGSRILWASYSFASTASAPWTINLSVSSASPNANAAAVYIDGVPAGTLPVTAGGTVSFSAGKIDAGFHGVIVQAVSGWFMISTVAVK
ncbi:MAG: hypothetical protein K2P57_00295 [Burkholderiales bacterium]|nr:hypothetical protein [Burkholderiales bacterium]